VKFTANAMATSIATDALKPKVAVAISGVLNLIGAFLSVAVGTLQGFAAETSSTGVILVSSQLGFPLSTTQVCSGAIFGAGVGRKLAAVRWGLAGQMVIAWVLTLPSAAIVGALAGRVAETGTTGAVLVAVVGLAIGGGIYTLSRRQPVGADNVNDVPANRPGIAAATA
jgi:PiT family inorganic phosphate transporter